MSASSYHTEKDRIRKAGKIFQQMFIRDPGLECQVRVAARKLREVVDRTVMRSSIEDCLVRDGVTYSRSEVYGAWKRAERIWAEIDNETHPSTAATAGFVFGG